MSEEDKRRTIAYLIKEIEVYKEPQDKDLSRLKSITFDLPVEYGDSGKPNFMWENETTVETVVLMSRRDK